MRRHEVHDNMATGTSPSTRRACAAALLIVLVMPLCGCGSTWTARDVGRGMQIGSMGGNGGWLRPIVWGTGFLVEKVGEAIETPAPSPVPGQSTDP